MVSGDLLLHSHTDITTTAILVNDRGNRLATSNY